MVLQNTVKTMGLKFKKNLKNEKMPRKKGHTMNENACAKCRVKIHNKSSDLTRRQILQRNAAKRATVQSCRRRKKCAKELEAFMAQDVNDTDHKLETSISDYSSSHEMIVSLNLNAYHSVRRAGIWTEFARNLHRREQVEH